MPKGHAKLTMSAVCAAVLLADVSFGTMAGPQRSSTKASRREQAAAGPRAGGLKAVPGPRRTPAAPARRPGVKGQLDAAIAKFEQDGDFEAARVSFQRIAKLSPRWGAPRYNLALLADWQERWADAAALYRQFLAIEPVSDSALRAQLRLDWIARLDATPAQSPEQARLLHELRLTRAITLTDSGRLSRAANEATKAIDADPTKWEAYALLATIQAEMGEFQGARTSCGEALKLAPEAQRRAIVEIEKRVSAEEAARELQKAGENALVRKEYGAAAADLARAWEKVPDRVEIGIAAAEAWALAGEYEKAVELLGRMAPHAAPPLAGRVRSLRDQLEPAATATALVRAPMTAEAVPSFESAEDETREAVQAAENASAAELNAAIATARKREEIRREYESEIEQSLRSAQFMEDSAEDFDRTAERAEADANRAASMGTTAGAILAGGQAALAVASRDRARDSRQKAANLRNRADALQRELEAGLPGVGIVAPLAAEAGTSTSRIGNSSDRELGEEPSKPATQPPLHPAVAVDPAVLAEYAGVYELSRTFSIEVTAVGGQLFGQATGQPKFELFAVSTTEFLLKVVDARIVFSRLEDGTVSYLTLYQGGQEIPFRKLRAPNANNTGNPPLAIQREPATVKPSSEAGTLASQSIDAAQLSRDPDAPGSDQAITVPEPSFSAYHHGHGRFAGYGVPGKLVIDRDGVSWEEIGDKRDESHNFRLTWNQIKHFRPLIGGEGVWFHIRSNAGRNFNYETDSPAEMQRILAEAYRNAPGLNTRGVR